MKQFGSYNMHNTFVHLGNDNGFEVEYNTNMKRDVAMLTHTRNTSKTVGKSS